MHTVVSLVSEKKNLISNPVSVLVRLVCASDLWKPVSLHCLVSQKPCTIIISACVGTKAPRPGNLSSRVTFGALHKQRKINFKQSSYD